MKAKIFPLFLWAVAFLSISSGSYAHDPPEGTTRGPSGNGFNSTYEMMGGHGGGMTGGHGGGMMDGGLSRYGEWIARFLDSFSNRLKKRDSQRDQEIQALKEDVREKRQEISSLFRSGNPDRKLIDQKIAELNELEDKLDEKLNQEDRKGGLRNKTSFSTSFP